MEYNLDRKRKEALKSNEYKNILYKIKRGHSFPMRRSKRYRIKPQTPWHCTICGDRFRSIDGILEVDKVCTCSKCRIRVCKLKCSMRNQEKKWLCLYCQESESWFKGIINILLKPNSKRDWYMQTSMMEPEALSELDEDLLELKKKERQQVRDFIERLVGAMLGGDLDEVVITKLYDDSNYERLYARYHTDLSTCLTDLGSALHISITNLPITGDSPCTAHASLKHLIQKFIQEASELPPLRVRRRQQQQEQQQQQSNDNEYNRSYEDLLSTAIINKVIQNYQESVGTSSRSSPSITINKRIDDDDDDDDDDEIVSNNVPETKEYFFSKETLDNKWKNSDGMDDSTSLSSYDDYIKSESSVSIKYYDDVSLTIQQSIEEVLTSSTSSSDADDDRPRQKINGSLLKVEDTNWQDNNNWHLQKRQFNNGCHSPVPVPMLVPNPVVEAKVLIGDRDAEDTTDLSDAASDYGDIDTVPTANTILIENKTIIGGKNAILNDTKTEDDILTDENVHKENVEIEETPEDVKCEKKPEDVKFDKQPKNDTFVTTKPEDVKFEIKSEDVKFECKVDDDIISEDGSTDDKEMIEEKEAVFSRFLEEKLETKNDVLINNSRTSMEDSLNSLDSNIEQNLEHTERYATLPKRIEIIQEPIPKPRNQKIHNDNNQSTDKQNTSNYVESIKDSYSVREKEKWKNAVEMENNPYTKENLERRLSGRSNSSSTSSLYGRDYYIKQAGRAAGASERFANKLMTEGKDENGKEEVKKDEEEELCPSQYDDRRNNKHDNRDNGANDRDNDGDNRDNDVDRSDTNKIEDHVIIPNRIERIKPIDDLQIVRAIPVLIDCTQSDLELSSSIETQSPIRPNRLDIMSSDSDVSIERTYNLKTGKITQRIGDIHKEVLTGAKSPEGTKYVPIRTELDDKNDTIVNCNVPFIRSGSTKILDNNNNDNDDKNNNNVDEDDKDDDQIDSFSLEYSDSCNSLDKKQYARIHSVPSSKGNGIITNVTKSDSLRESKSLNDMNEGEDEELPSVKNLKQLFEKKDKKDKQPPIYSLTARSIPNLLKNELKNEGNAQVEEKIIRNKEEEKYDIDDRDDEEKNDDEGIVLPSVKNRKAFFENLK